MKILYVEDDATARAYVERGLRERGFDVDAVGDAESGEKRALQGVYDLIVLDVMLPDLDGFELLRRLRATDVTSPVLFLSARGEVEDRIRGLELGGDDYLPKPFAFAELVARIRALARRRLGEPADPRLDVGDLRLDLRRREAARGDHPLDLTPKEFVLLEYLMRHAGQAVSRSMIIESVWGWGFETYSNLIDVHINRLRKKVDGPFACRLIHTVKGFGYMLEERQAAGGTGHA